MVSTSANVEEMCGGGPYFYKINGQVHHRIGTLQPSSGITPSYAQIYLYDTEEATILRTVAQSNENCDRSVMRLLSEHIVQVNPFAQKFRAVGNVFDELPPDRHKDIRMALIYDASSDQRRFNLPIADDVAAVFQSDDGCLLGEQDFIIYPTEGDLKNLPAHHSALDPMAYPLLFPYGDRGFNRNMAHNSNYATLIRNKLTQLQYASYRLAIRDGFSSLHR